MTNLKGPYGLRARNAEQRARAEADREARAVRLAPEIVTYWTDMIRRTAPHLGPAKRPCDYGPWIGALAETQRTPPFIGTRTPDHFDRYPVLMQIAEDIASPGWPAPRRDLIEFAMTFIEADVMLFRSGYAKRHLARRLQQSPLTGADVARIDKILRRTVTEGAGLEEFRAYGRLAAHLVTADRLPGLADWLAGIAEGAILTLDRADGAEWRVMFWDNPNLSELDKARLGRVHGLGPSKWGTVWPAMDRIVKAGRNLQADDTNKVKRNAYLMLRAIRRRMESAPTGR